MSSSKKHPIDEYAQLKSHFFFIPLVTKTPPVVISTGNYVLELLFLYYLHDDWWIITHNIFDSNNIIDNSTQTS